MMIKLLVFMTSLLTPKAQLISAHDGAVLDGINADNIQTDDNGKAYGIVSVVSGRTPHRRPTQRNNIDVNGRSFVFLGSRPSATATPLNESADDPEWPPVSTRSRRDVSDEGPVHRCGGFINESRGIISTPNFPRRFPIPIRCRWVIYAPPGKKVMLYLTQFYLREAFRVAEYDLYSSEDFYVGKDDLGAISFEETTWLMGYKPYMVLTFDVRELGNIHLRVESFLLDVYGFNITYELIPDGGLPRPDHCSVVECSFLGNCLASPDYKHQCHCFDGYYGDQCQYGPYCDPELQINLCKNGGRCRYFYGSMVNTCECPPMYEGPQCEIKKDNYLNSACEDMECSQLCVEDGSGDYQCDCKDGYKLSRDGKTCLTNAEGRLRFYIQIRVNAGGPPDVNTSLSFSCPNVQEAFLDLINKQLEDMVHDNVTLLSLSHINENIYINFYFMGLKADKDDIWLKMQTMVYQTSLCSLQMDGGYLVFDAQPAALHVITLRNYDKKPSIEGHLMTLFCKAKGSQHLTFQWLKDGDIIDVHKTERNMWESRIPTYDGETHISVLNIEKASPLDEGEFTCVASDWGQTDSRSLHVIVIPRPRMEVSPMMITAEVDSETAIACLSRDDYKTSQFKYTWEKDGLPLVPGINQEIVEDMLPRGSRVKLTAREPAVYTCTVQSEAGQNQGSSRLFVLKADIANGRLCHAELYRAVRWQTTAAGHADVQPCPKLSEGQARRRCVCEGESCQWLEPNFARCTSVHLDAIGKNFQRLSLGYQTSDLEFHVAQLNEFLDFEVKNKTYFRAGDVDKTARFLMDIQQYLYRFLSPSDKRHLYDKIFDTLDKILDLCLKATDDERKDLQITANVMKIVEKIRRDLVYFAKSLTYNSRHLDIEVQQDPDCEAGIINLYKSQDLQIWMENNTDLCDSTVCSYMVNYRNVVSVLNISSPNCFRNSGLVYVGLHSPDYDVRGLEIYIRYPADSVLQPKEVNSSICRMWDDGLQQGDEPHWTENGCDTVESGMLYTTCRCILPGHYVVFVENLEQKAPESIHLDDVIHLPILICLVVAQCGFVVSLSVQILFWKSLVHEHRMVSLTFTITIIILCSILVRGVTHQNEEVLCLVMKLSLYFLALVILCSRLAEAVSLYTISLNTHAEMIYAKSLATCAELFIIIGIPLIVFIPIPIVGKVKGFSNKNGLFCWITADDWEFYGLAIPSGILLMVFVILIGLGFKNNHDLKGITIEKNRKRFRFYLLRCAISQFLLCGVLITSVLFNQNITLMYEWLHGSMIVILAVFMVITVYPKMLLTKFKKKKSKSCSLCNIQETTMCVGDCSEQCCTLPIIKPKMTHTTSSSSFKGFVRPQYNQDGAMEIDAEEALKRDRMRYTKEKKEQLVALLGQSSSSESSKESQAATSSLTSSSEADRCDGTEEEEETGQASSRRVSASRLTSTRTRHHANSLCSCSHCGTKYPFRPARGQSLISVKDDACCPIRKNLSYAGAACRSPEAGRRQSMPDPFPELSESPPGGDPAAASADGTRAADRKRTRRPTGAVARVTFFLGDEK